MKTPLPPFLRKVAVTGIVLLCGWGAHAQTAKQNLAKFDYSAYHLSLIHI